MKIRSKRMWAVVVIVGLVILVLAARLIREAFLDAELARLLEQANLLSIEELKARRVEDAENAAAVYRRAWETMERGQPRPDWPWDKVPEDSKNEMKARNVLLNALERGDYGSTEEKLVPLKDYLQRNQNVIELLLEAARMEKCDFGLEYEKGPAMELPHLSKMRESARLLWIAAVAAALEGEMGRAAEYCWAVARTGNHLEEESLVISQLVRAAICSIAADSLHTIVHFGEVSPEWRAKVDVELVRYQGVESSASLKTEAAISFYSVKSLAEGEGDAATWLLEMQGGSSGEGGLYGLYERGWPWLMYESWLVGRPFVKWNMVRYLKSMNELEAAFDQPYWEAKPALDKWEDNVTGLSRWYVIPKLLLPALARYREQVAHTQARAGATRLGLALEAYKRDHGAYPIYLDVPAPDYIGEMPEDPFTGEPYVYRREGGGFVVYSVGSNGRDDDGRRSSDRSQDYDDICWRSEEEGSDSASR